MELQWYHWGILGIVLMLSELVVPAFVLVWFGLGAVLVAVVVALFPQLNLIAQLLLWALASVAFVILFFKVFKIKYHKTMAGRSSAQAVGEVGLMVSPVEPFQKGQVRFQVPLIGADVWDCVADEAIKAGTRVKVVSVEGSLLKVTNVEKIL